MIKNLTPRMPKFDIMQNFLIAFLLLFNHVYGQSGASGRFNSNSPYQLKSDTGKLVDIRERLVQLALQNPTYEIADHTLMMTEYQIRLAKGEWLSTLFAAGNINEFTINPPPSQNGTTGAQYFYPRYNFGVNIPMDIFSRVKNTVKIAKQNYLIAQAQKNDKFREIREQVLTKYEDYLMQKDLLDLQVLVTQDEYILYQRAQKDFQDGLIKLDDFDKSYKNWVLEQTKRLTAQRNLNVTKIEMERIIGVKLEDVLQQR